MPPVKRYNVDIETRMMLYAPENGRFVYYEDYAELEKETEALRELLRDFTARYFALQRECS